MPNTTWQKKPLQCSCFLVSTYILPTFKLNFFFTTKMLYDRGRRNFVFNFGSTKLTGHTLRLGLPLVDCDIVARRVIRTESSNFTGVALFTFLSEYVSLLLRLCGVLDTNSGVLVSSNECPSLDLLRVRRCVMNFSFNGVMDFFDCTEVSMVRTVDALSSLLIDRSELRKVDGRSFSLFESTLDISWASDTVRLTTIDCVPSASVVRRSAVSVDSCVDVTNEICSELLASLSSSFSSVIVFRLDAGSNCEDQRKQSIVKVSGKWSYGSHSARLVVV